jgi:hypothetical protein
MVAEQGLARHWQAAFWQTVQQEAYAAELRQAALYGRLGQWTAALTGVVVATCEVQGWQAAGKGYPLALLPESRHEYLGLDVVAFASGDGRWPFPAAVFELENSRQDDRIAYSLWKTLCLRADLRLVFCYRAQSEQASALVEFLQRSVIQPLTPADRMSLGGETVLVIGRRAEAVTFPYSFFQWWKLEYNTGVFRLV